MCAGYSLFFNKQRKLAIFYFVLSRARLLLSLALIFFAVPILIITFHDQY